MPRALPAAGPRDRILDAADRLLARYGYRKMTVDDIAQEAGIGKGTVYLSFPAKEEIALSCIDRMVDRLLERLRADRRGARTGSSRGCARCCASACCTDSTTRATTPPASTPCWAAVRPALLARRARTSGPRPWCSRRCWPRRARP